MPLRTLIYSADDRSSILSLSLSISLSQSICNLSSLSIYLSISQGLNVEIESISHSSNRIVLTSLVRAGVRQRRNLAVATRSQVRRGHDRRRRGFGVRRRFATVYLQVL